MKSEAVKLAQIHRDTLVINQTFEVLKNPVFSLVAAFVIIEALQAVEIGEKKRPLMGQNVGTMLEGGLVASPFLIALADSGTLKAGMEQAAGLLGSITGAAGKAIPMLAMKGV